MLLYATCVWKMSKLTPSLLEVIGAKFGKSPTGLLQLYLWFLLHLVLPSPNALPGPQFSDGPFYRDFSLLESHCLF